MSLKTGQSCDEISVSWIVINLFLEMDYVKIEDLMDYTIYFNDSWSFLVDMVKVSELNTFARD